MVPSGERAWTLSRGLAKTNMAPMDTAPGPGAVGTALEIATSQPDCPPEDGHVGVRLREEALRALL